MFSSLNHKKIYMRLAPKTSFGQSLGLVCLLLGVNFIIFNYIVRINIVEPSIAQMTELMGAKIDLLLNKEEKDPNLIIKSMQQKINTEAFKAYHYNEALENGLLKAGDAPKVKSLLLSFYPDMLDLKIDKADDYIIWISPRENIWVKSTLYKYSKENIAPIYLYIIIIVFITAFGAWRIYIQNIALKELEKSAILVSEGKIPDNLPLKGSREVSAVISAFNKMINGIKLIEEDRVLLMAGISHDLRTPMTRISFALELIDNIDSDSKENIKEEIKSMDHIIEQFLDYININIRNDEVSNINEVIQEIIDIENRVKIDFNSSQEIICNIRSVDLKRIINNIFENAIRYGNGEIKVNLFKNDSDIIIYVDDNGCGIDLQKKDMLFQPFYREDLARTNNGSGLGLAIVRKILRSYGGEVSIENISPKGARVKINIPLYPKNS